MQARGNRVGTAISQGGKDRRNIIEYSVAEWARGREGSGQERARAGKRQGGLPADPGR